MPLRAVPRPSCSSEHSRQKEKRGRGGHGVPGVTSLADVILAYTQISVATSASHDGYALAVRDCPRIAAQSNQKTARAMHPLFARGLDTLLNLQVRAHMPLLPRIATSSHLIPYHPRWLRFFVVSLFCRPGCGTSPPPFPPPPLLSCSVSQHIFPSFVHLLPYHPGIRLHQTLTGRSISCFAELFSPPPGASSSAVAFPPPVGPPAWAPAPQVATSGLLVTIPAADESASAATVMNHSMHKIA